MGGQSVLVPPPSFGSSGYRCLLGERLKAPFNITGNDVLGRAQDVVQVAGRRLARSPVISRTAASTSPFSARLGSMTTRYDLASISQALRENTLSQASR